MANDIEFYFSATERQTYPKLGLRTKVKGDYVIITSFNGGFAPSGDNASLRIRWQDVTSPTVTSASTLSVIIMGYASGVSLGGGASAGGGNNTYSTASNDFIATPTVGAKTITITGLPFILEAKHVIAGWVKKRTSTGVVSTVATANVVVSGGVVTLSEESNNFASGDEIIMTLVGADKAYDQVLDNQLVNVQNPDYAHTTSVETLASGTNLGTRAQHTGGVNAAALATTGTAFSNANVAIGYKAYNTTDGSNATVTSVSALAMIGTLAGGVENDWDTGDFANLPGASRFEISMDTYKNLSIHYKMTTGTAADKMVMQIWGTNNAAATVDDDTSWVNLSADFLGSLAGVSVTGIAASLEDILFIDINLTVLKLMVKLVSECSTNGAFSNAYDIYVKKAS